MEIIYGDEKIKQFISSLDQTTFTQVFRVIDLLKKHGNLLDMPDSKSLGKGLFELRTKGKVKIRILYVFHKDKAYLLHVFAKKAWKINIRDVRYARYIQQEIIRLA